MLSCCQGTDRSCCLQRASHWKRLRLQQLRQRHLHRLSELGWPARLQLVCITEPLVKCIILQSRFNVLFQMHMSAQPSKLHSQGLSRRPWPSWQQNLAASAMYTTDVLDVHLCFVASFKTESTVLAAVPADITSLVLTDSPLLDCWSVHWRNG